MYTWYLATLTLIENIMCWMMTLTVEISIKQIILFRGCMVLKGDAWSWKFSSVPIKGNSRADREPNECLRRARSVWMARRIGSLQRKYFLLIKFLTFKNDPALKNHLSSDTVSVLFTFLQKVFECQVYKAWCLSPSSPAHYTILRKYIEFKIKRWGPRTSFLFLDL